MKTLALAFVAILLLSSSVFSQPIEISTPDQLQAIGADETSLAGEYVLVNDIDLAGYPWESIWGFSGTFDGNGHVVKGITQNHEGEDYARAAGLFGKTLAGSVVKNVGVVDCNIASQWYTAALVGDLFGEASNCFAINGSVSVAGDCGNTGTLIGMVRESGSLSNCYSNLEFILSESSGWPDTHGGLIGYVAGPVTNCYYAGLLPLRVTYPEGDFSVMEQDLLPVVATSM